MPGDRLNAHVAAQATDHATEATRETTPLVNKLAVLQAPCVLADKYLGQLNFDQVSRYLVKDFGTSKSQNRLANATTYCAPDALRPCRFATPSQARRWLRSPPSNGWTAC